jgi:diacylglycerol kinase family enzyme
MNSSSLFIQVHTSRNDSHSSYLPFIAFKNKLNVGGIVTRIACILNPKARDGLSISQWSQFEKSLQNSGYKIDLFHTEYIGHGMDLAANLRESEHEIVVAVGGDGTVHEVASGLRGSGKVMGILPIGSGNDYARAHGIPIPKGKKFLKMQEAVDILTNGVDRNVGAFRVEGPPAPAHTLIPAPIPHVCNGNPNNSNNIVRWSFLECDSGVTSAVNRMKTEGKFKRVRGQLKYTFLGIRAILGWKTQKGWIKIDDNPGEVVDLSGLFCMSQCQTFGGGFIIAPGASPTQNHGSLVSAWGLSKIQMLLVMGPLEKGKHIGKWNKIFMKNALSMELKAVDSNDMPTNKSHNPDLFVNVDGEAVMTTPISLKYFENQITVRGAKSIPNQ